MVKMTKEFQINAAKDILNKLECPTTVGKLANKTNLRLDQVRMICEKLSKANIIYLTKKQIMEKLNVIPEDKLHNAFKFSRKRAKAADNFYKYEDMEEQLSTRKCKVDHGGCGKLLPMSRYYLCRECQPILPEDIEGELLYFDFDVSEQDEDDYITTVGLKRS